MRLTPASVSVLRGLARFSLPAGLVPLWTGLLLYRANLFLPARGGSSAQDLARHVVCNLLLEHWNPVHVLETQGSPDSLFGRQVASFRMRTIRIKASRRIDRLIFASPATAGDLRHGRLEAIVALCVRSNGSDPP